jgi:hypothetical protein
MKTKIESIGAMAFVYAAVGCMVVNSRDATGRRRARVLEVQVWLKVATSRTEKQKAQIYLEVSTTRK